MEYQLAFPAPFLAFTHYFFGGGSCTCMVTEDKDMATMRQLPELILNVVVKWPCTP